MTESERLIIALLRRIARALEIGTAVRADVAAGLQPDEIGDWDERKPCPECGVYGGGHMQGCSLMPADE